jgi:hypothetical protein
MTFNLFGNETIKSPEQLSERRALVRALMMRQLSQRPRDTWDGINNLVSAISGRITQSQLDKAETVDQLSDEGRFAPLVKALKKKQASDADTITGGFSNTSFNPDQRAIAKALFRRQLKTNDPFHQ